MRNLLASALVALLVSVAVSGAADQKPTHGIGTAVTWRASGPSDSQRIDALIARVDQLQVRLADTREIAQSARTLAENANNVTVCLTGGVWMTQATDTGAWTNGDGTEPDAVIVPTLDASCTGPA